MAHKNSNSNNLPHHLYEIRDKVENEVFKYGISSEPFGSDGLSKRVRLQVNFLNLIHDWPRFYAHVLLVNITGRMEARRIERAHIKAWRQKNGRNPKGNLD